MISFEKYGFKHQSAFRNARNVPEKVFDALMTDKDWKMRKQVLLHPDCPIRIRDKVRAKGVWYERIVAICAKSAPPQYWRHAKNDHDKRVVNTYRDRVWYGARYLRMLLWNLKVVTAEQAKIEVV